MTAYVTMPLRISADLAERIDAHWHKHRLMSRAAAIRDILERGLSWHEPRESGEQGREGEGDHDVVKGAVG
jgi:metal-responsive CopG/Arc/MetJ family transcriptional regulator